MVKWSCPYLVLLLNITVFKLIKMKNSTNFIHQENNLTISLDYINYCGWIPTVHASQPLEFLKINHFGEFTLHHKSGEWIITQVTSILNLLLLFLRKGRPSSIKELRNSHHNLIYSVIRLHQICGFNLHQCINLRMTSISLYLPQEIKRKIFRVALIFIMIERYRPWLQDSNS